MLLLQARKDAFHFRADCLQNKQLGAFGDRVMRKMHGCRRILWLVTGRPLHYLSCREVNERGLPCSSS
ncbi:hypothetical protein FB004_102359 [Sinorhizobium medicae]|nr:hypothetical protein FB006_104280 [Sinorhizobium medicae]TWA27385.1 hypothetical protein FB004_102359 [Sinorhizobium medicae]TWA35428.1 hypothetical protein FB007_106279 [Sinorhizobium medicae]TWA43542.1 hypothetical protein FB009_102311 [Sinorhizobium medicae]TWA45543.1 hypothetical protein FB005_105128 [Sinorhizobium medicae]